MSSNHSLSENLSQDLSENRSLSNQVGRRILNSTQIESMIRKSTWTYLNLEPGQYTINNYKDLKSAKVDVDDLNVRGRMVYITALHSIQNGKVPRLNDWKLYFLSTKNNLVLVDKSSGEIHQILIYSVNPSNGEKWVLTRSGSIYVLS